METLLPKPLPPYRVIHRIKGLGSLGRQAVFDGRWPIKGGGMLGARSRALLLLSVMRLDQQHGPG